MDDMRVALEVSLGPQVSLPLLKAHVGAADNQGPEIAMNATISQPAR
jgi:hypothetical protein